MNEINQTLFELLNSALIPFAWKDSGGFGSELDEKGNLRNEDAPGGNGDGEGNAGALMYKSDMTFYHKCQLQDVLVVRVEEDNPVGFWMARILSKYRHQTTRNHMFYILWYECICATEGKYRQAIDPTSNEVWYDDLSADADLFICVFSKWLFRDTCEFTLYEGMKKNIIRKRDGLQFEKGFSRKLDTQIKAVQAEHEGEYLQQGNHDVRRYASEEDSEIE